MKCELSRQLVHLAAITFIILSFYVDSVFVSAYSFVIAAGLLVYVVYFHMEKKRLLRLVEKIEAPLRKTLLHLENRPSPSPKFAGAFWFFFSIGLSFAIFPLQIAQAAVLILALGDSASTIIGRAIGEKRILGKKTLEGSLSFFIVSLASVIFVPSPVAIFGALVGTLAELVPELKIAEPLRSRGILNDNLLIPVIAGMAMWLVL